jgi:arabinose-5-phosphate isomerase
MTDEQMLHLAQQIIRQEIAALESAAAGFDSSFVVVARLLAACTGLVWVTGVGTSAAVGSRFAHILSCCGRRSMLLSPADGLHGHSAVFQPEDLLVAISRGGESEEVNRMVRIARDRGTPTIALVHDTGSTLAQTADHVLPIHSPAEYELLGYLATTSTIVFSAVCDGLCAVVAQATGRSADELRGIHPGGAVGRQLTER